MSDRRARVKLAVLTGIVVVAGACVPGPLRRVAGSDITLPEPAHRTVIRSLVSGCNDGADTLTTSREPITRCGRVAGDTARSTSDPLVPSGQKTP